MKKSLFTLLGGMFAFGVMAQSNLQPTNKIEVKDYQIPFHSKLRVNSSANAGGQVSQWFSYASLQENLNGFEGSSMLLFPDSSVLVVYMNNGTPASYNNTWISAGQALDPKDIEFSLDGSTSTLSKFNDYTVDSIKILYLYDRTIHTSVDTMVVTFHKSQATTATGSLSTWNYGTAPNKKYFATTDFDRTTHEPAKTGIVYEVRMPLTALDSNANGTTWGEKNIAIPSSFGTIPKGMVVGATVSFKPGYTYSAGDTLLATMDLPSQPVRELNKLWVRTLLRNGNNVEHDYFNNGMAIDKTQLYTDRWEALGSRYLPSNFYSVSQFVHIDYLISSANVGIKNINGNGYGMGNAYPNPVSGNSAVNVPFAIGKSGDVTLTVTNIIGQNVSVSTEKFNAGENTFTVDLNNLKPGVYFYTISSGNFTSTKKFTVTE
ncbi:MAG: T9SS type A sorting domain-containing protein [Bacteroidia bacterium]|nr:T9SS type A sorting domain-containing protein [Bacteroidia bacterium]